MKHVSGEIDMSPTQVRAASILLNKVLPDLKSVDMQSRIETTSVFRMTDEQLMAIAAQGLPEAIEGECEAVQEPLKLVGDQ